MDNFDEINNFESLFLTDLHEPNDNSLFLTVKKSIMAEVTEDLVVGKTVLKGLRRIEIDENSTYFTILFENYVAYHVINESFSNFNEREVEPIRRTSSFCVYCQSTYLDFILKETYANKVYLGDLKHYCLYCENHIIHIISNIAPIIEIVGCS